MDTDLHINEILSIGFDNASHEKIHDAFVDEQLAVTSVDTAVDAVSLLEKRDFDCVLSIYPLKDGERTDELKKVREAKPDLPVVVVLTDGDTATDAMNEGAAEYLRESVLDDHPDLLERRIIGAVEDERARASDRRESDADDLVDAIASQTESAHSVADAIVTNFPNGAVTLVDEDLIYKLAGGQLFDTLTSSPDDVIGSHVGELRSGDRDVFVRSYKDALDGEETVTEVLVNDTTLLHRTVPVENKNGSIVAAVGMTQDISEQKQRERDLERNREFLRDIQGVANIGGWEIDLRSETIRWTDEVYRIHGLSLDYDPSFEDAIDFYHPDDRDTIERAYDALVSDGEPWDLELRLETTDDTVRWVRTRGEPWIDEDENQVGARGTFQDITERKNREQELHRKSRAIEAAPIGIVMTDPTQDDNPITYANQEFLENTGYDYEEVHNRNCRFLQGEATESEPVSTIRAAIDAERPVSATLRNYRKDGTEFWNHLEIAPVTDEDGELLDFVGFQQDVTDRIEYERELEESRNRYRTLVEHFPNGAVTLVDEDLCYKTVGGSPIDDATSANTRFEGVPVEEALTDEMAATLRPKYESALEGEDHAFEKTFDDTVYQFQIIPVRDDEGSVFAAMGVSQDVTELKERQQTLEKRERILRQLHVASRAFYPPDSMDDVSTFVVDFLEETFEFDYISVKRFDEEAGVLRPAARSVPLDGATGIGTVEPGDSFLWDAYRSGESRVLEVEQLPDMSAVLGFAVNQCLVVPIGKFGLAVVFTADDTTFDDVDRDLIEVLTTNAQAVFQSLHHDHERDQLAGQVETQQQRLEELHSIVDVVQTVQRRVADSESRDELEVAVCEELIETDHIDFAWIGRPRSSDDDLTTTAWAGAQTGYLDSVLPNSDGISLPAEHAATQRAPYHVSKISQRVLDDNWAKEALSAQFRSALSVPLIYDDVLYGVLTAYSSTENGFEQQYQDLVGDVASLLVTYSRILEQRFSDANTEYVQLEFELADTTYPLHRLATETACQLQYDTVTETTEETICVLVTVVEGDRQAVLERADDVPSIIDASQFGAADSQQIRLTVERPYLASDVSKHGGRLLEAVSDDVSTRILIEVPTNVSTRPLLDALTNRFQDIEMVAQRQHIFDSDRESSSLTERQYELLNAAYHGGYYETPRNVTGEGLAEEFGISGPALYKHLQAAHRKVLGQFLEQDGQYQR